MPQTGNDDRNFCLHDGAKFSDPQHPLQPKNKKWINEKNESLRSACDLLEFPAHKLASP